MIPSEKTESKVEAVYEEIESHLTGCSDCSREAVNITVILNNDKERPLHQPSHMLGLFAVA